MLAPGLAKQNPQAIGALGGFRLELRPLRRLGDVGGGDRGMPRSNTDISGAALQTTIAPWSCAVAPWYAAFRTDAFASAMPEAMRPRPYTRSGRRQRGCWYVMIQGRRHMPMVCL